MEKKYIIGCIIIIGVVIGINRIINYKHSDNNNKHNTSYIIIGLDEAKSKYDEGEYIFIDARSEIFYYNGHIKGSKNISINSIDNFINKKEILINRGIIVYCNGSECSSSYLIANELVKRGFQKIEVFYGGWNDWVKAGYPIETIK